MDKMVEDKFNLFKIKFAPCSLLLITDSSVPPIPYQAVSGQDG